MVETRYRTLPFRIFNLNTEQWSKGYFAKRSKKSPQHLLLNIWDVFGQNSYRSTIIHSTKASSVRFRSLSHDLSENMSILTNRHSGEAGLIITHWSRLKLQSGVI